MKKLIIMLKDQLRTPLSDPVSRGLQKQFRISKMVCGLIAALVMTAASVQGGGIVVIKGQNWQPSYSGWWQKLLTVTYHYTDEDLRPLKDANGNKIGGTINLQNNDHALKIPVPANAYDIAYACGWAILDNDNNFCSTSADSMALSQVGGKWVDDTTLQAFAANQGADVAWQSFFLAPPSLNGTLYYDVDLTAYYAGGAPLYPDDGSMDFNIVNGTCALLPGYVFGTSPVDLDPDNGLVTADPFTGDVTSGGAEGLCPDSASTLALLGLGTLSLLAYDWRRRTA